MTDASALAPIARAPQRWPAVAVWGLTGLALYLADPGMDLANKALVLVLAAAIAAVWSTPWFSVMACACSVLLFNLAFVPPRGTFSVHLDEHALLLATMLAASWGVSLLMTRQRELAASQQRLRLYAQQLGELGDALRAVDDPRQHTPRLVEALSTLCGHPAAVWLAAVNEPPDCAADEQLLGMADPQELARLRGEPGLSDGATQAAPPHAWVLKLRGRSADHGAALMRFPEGQEPDEALRAHAQALCDQMGAALERAQALHAARAAREAAQSQALRNTLLAAISHDHRTPLATILGAASALHDQDGRLSDEQRRRLAATIVEEASQLARLTDNTLQLARLDAPGRSLHLDWESCEEIIGTVMRRVRPRDSAHRVRASVPMGLPLVRCDAVLLVQLLDNLVDNALRYASEDSPVELVAERQADHLVIAVRDGGPGVGEALRERIFEAFQRGEPPDRSLGADAPARRGAGVGLAVCRAIARAHGGELTLRPRSQGGSSFELRLPIEPSPEAEPSPGDEERQA